MFALMNVLGVLPLSFPYLGLIVFCSMVADIDIVRSPSHRNMFTHTPLFWGCISVAIIVINQGAWFVTIPLLLHLFLDTLDYKLMVLYPFSRRKYGLGLLDRGSESKTKALTSYFKEYLADRRMFYVELVIMLVSLLLLIAVVTWS